MLFRIWNDSLRCLIILRWDTDQQSFHYPIIIPDQPPERRGWISLDVAVRFEEAHRRWTNVHDGEAGIKFPPA